MTDSLEKKIFRGTIVIVLIGFCAKFTAFITGTILASRLGVSYQSDAFYMIDSIKDVLYPMMSIGIWKVFLPLYKEKLTQNNMCGATLLAHKAISFFTLISIVAVLLMLFFSEQIVSVIAPGFQGITKELCVKLVRLSAPMNAFIVASSVYASMLQCHNKFLGSQIREVATHIPTILAALFFYESFGIEALAISLVIGGIVRLGVEIPFVDWGYSYKPNFDFKSKEFIVMLKRIPSALMATGVTQLNTMVDKVMATMLSVGAISGLTYGHKLLNVFSGLLSSAIATALYPQMIELIALNKLQELSKLIAKIINVFCLLMFPMTVGCILFSHELVSAVYQRGLFNEYSVKLTSSIFAFYCLGLFFIACNSVISNLFYGFGNTKTPMLISLVHLVVNVFLNICFVHFWGVNGLALATSIAAFVVFFVQLKVANNFVNIDKKGMLLTAIKVLIASIIACGIPKGFFYIYPVNKYFVLVFSFIIGILIYFMIIKLLRIYEIEYVITLLKNKVRKVN